MKRLAIAFFYDEHGIVDEYMAHLVGSFAPFVEKTVFICNCDLSKQSEIALRELDVEIITRENVGFDVWAYKQALETVGFDDLQKYDEILLYNHTFFGPIFPFSEMFGKMEATQCDFWGITAHKEMTPNPFTNIGVLPRHINSHFIAVRRDMAVSRAFRTYWENMAPITSYQDSILLHESRFTHHFESLGYTSAVYDDDETYGSHYPSFINMDEAVERRCPILKRRPFFHDSSFLEQNAIDLPRALRIMRATSDYPERLIWPNILRTARLRVLSTNAALTSVLPSNRPAATEAAASGLRLAVCAHVYYTDAMPELLAHMAHIKQPYDFIATTDTAKKQSEIEQALVGVPNISKVIIKVMPVNRGRDMAALFITCRDIFLEDTYDLVCRLHTKKSPQVTASRSNSFKRHMLENLLESEGFVAGVIDLFTKRSWLGLAVPPLVHISYPTMGNAWFTNKERAIEVARKLKLRVHFDYDTPVAAYGTMFWFRPSALRRLFAQDWKYEDFNAEPNHVDGGLAHVIERLIAYAAQDAGYTTEQILSEHQAAWNYNMLEYKLQRLGSFMPWEFGWQVHMLSQWASAGYPILRQG